MIGFSNLSNQLSAATININTLRHSKCILDAQATPEAQAVQSLRQQSTLAL
jgi:hypothetical protein